MERVVAVETAPGRHEAWSLTLLRRQGTIQGSRGFPAKSAPGGRVSAEIEKQPHAMGVYFISLVSALMVRRSDAISRRHAIASAVYRPCLNAFLLPLGAPGDFPPCIRQRPFGIAGDWHRLPLRVRAPHRRLRCMGNLLSMGWSL